MILDCLPGVSVSIMVDRQATHEWRVEPDQSDLHWRRTAISYVEAVPGATFSVKLTTTPAYAYRKDDLRIETLIDGSLAEAQLVRREHMQERYSRSVKGVQTGNQFRCFKFADLKTIPDGNARFVSTYQMDRLGEVTVRLFPCRENKNPKKPAASSDTVFTASAAGVPEKALKGRALSCSVGLGEAKTVGGTSGRVAVRYLRGDWAIAIYRFRYRTRRDLQIENVIARSPTPVPLEERDVDSLNVDEARALARQLKERNDALATRVKQEIKTEKRPRVIELSDGEDDSDSNAEPEVSVTSERDRRKRVKIEANVEVVDLS